MRRNCRRWLAADGPVGTLVGERIEKRKLASHGDLVECTVSIGSGALREAVKIAIGALDQ
jgi:hypothetical protein